MPVTTIQWEKDHIKLVDQTRLPQKFVHVRCKTVSSLFRAIRRLSVRGAPALGAAGGLGVLLAAHQYKGNSPKALIKKLTQTADYLATSRPTAVNLFYALNNMKRVAETNQNKSIKEIRTAIEREAFRIVEEDRQLCRAIGRAGSQLIKNGMNVLTICNTGALATVDYGTALGVLFRAKAEKKKFHVYACETRPLLQGARLNTWELLREGIKTTLICDSMAAFLMKDGRIDIVLTGADRIAANGDAANKIGTYSLAVLAKYHKVPFYIVAPSTTVDLSIRSGKQIPIEERKKEEVTHFRGVQSSPKDVHVYNPAFDVTPHQLITGIVTERGIHKKPFNFT